MRSRAAYPPPRWLLSLWCWRVCFFGFWDLSQKCSKYMFGNVPNIVKTCFQNCVKSRPGGGLGASWAPLGRPLAPRRLPGYPWGRHGRHCGSILSLRMPPTSRCFGIPFLGMFLDRFLTDFGSHSGGPNPPTWHENRCQDAFPVWPHFGIDFLMILDSKIHLPITPVNAIMIWISNWNYHFIKIVVFQSILKFDSIWEPFELHFGIKNPPTSKYIALPGDIKNGSNFYKVFYWILACFGGGKIEPKTNKNPSRIRVLFWTRFWRKFDPKVPIAPGQRIRRGEGREG